MITRSADDDTRIVVEQEYDNIEWTLDELRENIVKWEARVPDILRKSIVIHFRTYEGGIVEITRAETPDEEVSRLREKQAWLDQYNARNEKQDRETYERLKLKFEGKPIAPQEPRS